MEGNNMFDKKIQDASTSKLRELSKKKIYFGHKSVGSNIMLGLQNLIEENPKIKLNIRETINKSDFKNGIFAHSKIGENLNPKSKMDDFYRLMSSESLGEIVDTAFMKFCYVDITSATDIHQVFKEYKITMEQLKKDFPEVDFIHITVPLKATRFTLKVRFQRFIRRKKLVPSIKSNIKRNQFNLLLFDEYKQKDPIFDLAKAEYTYPNGSVETFIRDGKEYYSMVPEYTYDGGHLNKLGQKAIAEQLLLFLIDL
jgi:hypothetical protein